MLPDELEEHLKKRKVLEEERKTLEDERLTEQLRQESVVIRLKPLLSRFGSNIYE